MTKLPVGRIFTIDKLVKVVYGKEGDKRTGIQLYLDNGRLRTNLPGRMITTDLILFCIINSEISIQLTRQIRTQSTVI